MKPEALIDAFDQAGALSGDSTKALTVQWAAWLAGNWERIPPNDRTMMVAVGGVLFDKGAGLADGFAPSLGASPDAPTRDLNPPL